MVKELQSESMGLELSLCGPSSLEIELCVPKAGGTGRAFASLRSYGLVCLFLLRLRRGALLPDGLPVWAS